MANTSRDIFSVLFTQSFRFTAPYSVEECLIRLEQKAKRGTSALESLLFSHRVLYSASYSAGASSFTLQKVAGKTLKVALNGQLARANDQSTLVTGSARISTLTYLLVIVPSLPFFYWSSFGFYKAAIGVALIDFVVLGLCYWARTNLVAMVHAALK